MSTGSLTKYPDVGEIVDFFVRGVVPALEGNVLGVYLTGSLSYGAFNYGSSDIDITVIVKRPVSRGEVDSIGQLHREMEGKFEKWARRFECSYTPVEMLPSIVPPKEPRPWYWGADRTLFAEAPFGNEWIINNYLLHRHSIVLFGPSFKKLVGPIDIEEVRRACVRDLFKEWAPKKSNREWFSDSHFQSYFVLNLCRILHTVVRSTADSKKMAASWVMENYGERWRVLINRAQDWEYGIELNLRREAMDFLDFVTWEVSKTAVYRQVEEEAELGGVGLITDR